VTENQKAQICALRKQGAGYMKIAQQTGISQNTIKSFCRRNNLTGTEKADVPVADGSVCECCGKAMVQSLDNPLIRPVITPRFVPSCSAELMQGLGELAAKYDVPVQSHLNENTDEIVWVKELFPEYEYYYQVYEAFGLFGQETTAMAHCIHLMDEEVDALADSGVYAVHCPLSNLNLSSGEMRLRRLMNEGVTLALGSDVGGGNTLFMPQVIASAIQVSKMVAEDYPEEEKLSLPEGFWLATKSGGSFFGTTGSFEKGYDADVLVIETPDYISDNTAEERLEWFIYNGSQDDIKQVYVAGKQVQ